MILDTLQETISLKIAGYDIYPVPTGEFGLDGGAMFGTVPKILWEKTNPADEQNRIKMEARALLLVSKNKKILIDTGNGSDFIAKYGEKLGNSFSKMYNLTESENSLTKSLQRLHLTTDDITDVVLTHLHFDHAGGATSVVENEIKPAFKNAKYYLQTTNLETAKNPNKREKASYLENNYKPLIENQCLILLNKSKHENLPHISFQVSNGHTIGHQAVIIADDHQQIIYCGDVIPTATHVRLAWIMGYDLNPLLLMEEKKILLERSIQKKTYYFFEHDPYCDIAMVKPDKDDFKVDQKFWLKTEQSNA